MPPPHPLYIVVKNAWKTESNIHVKMED